MKLYQSITDKQLRGIVKKRSRKLFLYFNWLKTRYNCRYCTDQSSDSGIDQSHGGTPKAGSTGRLAGQAKVSVGSRIRGAEEGGGIKAERGGLRPR